MGTGFIPPELVAKAKEMDLLTFLQTYEPDELVRVSPHEYCTRTHDSLKISNGKWMWWSRGFGGKNAVDYLIAVKGLTFYQAVRTILDYSGHSRPPNAFDEPRREKHLILPERAESNDTVIRYLKGRYDEIVYPAYNDASPLFWADSIYDISDASKIGYCSVPETSPEIQGAADDLHAADKR